MKISLTLNDAGDREIQHGGHVAYGQVAEDGKTYSLGQCREIRMTTYTHVGFRRETGRIHGASLYGHADYSGTRHALNGTANTFSGATYKALCGKVVIAEHDGERFNVLPATEGNGVNVSCKRCKAVLLAARLAARLALERGEVVGTPVVTRRVVR